jgi:hypothetical protein
MSTISAPTSHLTTEATPTATVRAGLALSAVIGLSTIPFLFPIIDWGAEEPPFAMMLLSFVIGMVSVACAIVAWNSGNRKAIRINAGALIFNALTTVPGLFVDASAFIKVFSAVSIIGSLVAVVTTMRRERTPVRVVD